MDRFVVYLKDSSGQRLVSSGSLEDLAEDGPLG